MSTLRILWPGLFLELSNIKGTFTPTYTLHPNETALNFEVVTKGERTAMGKRQ